MAAADDDDPLARDVEVVRPLLRVDQRAGVALDAREDRRVALVVAVVAARAEQPRAGEPAGLAAGLDLDGPVAVLARPRRAADRVAVADQPVDAALAGGLAQVLQDVRSVGDGLAAVPGAEAVGEGREVGVGPDAGVAEQAPRAAELVARLQQREAALRVLLAQVVRDADAGQAGADDEDVEVLEGLRAHGPVVPATGSVRSVAVPCPGPSSGARRSRPWSSPSAAPSPAGPTPSGSRSSRSCWRGHRSRSARRALSSGSTCAGGRWRRCCGTRRGSRSSSSRRPTRSAGCSAPGP